MHISLNQPNDFFPSKLTFVYRKYENKKITKTYIKYGTQKDVYHVIGFSVLLYVFLSNLVSMIFFYQISWFLLFKHNFQNIIFEYLF